MDLMHIWNSMGLTARLVVFTLVGMGLASLVVAIERLLVLSKARAASMEFAAKSRALIEGGEFDDVLALTQKYQASPLAQLFQYGLRAWSVNREDSVVGPVEMASREISRKLEDIAMQVRRGMGILATTGSTAPFVGLFGTVVGIITVFTQMAAAGGGGFETVSAGIAEALIVTGLGLVIAIVAVWLFNYLNTQFERLDMQLQHASSELVDFLEAKGGRVTKSE